MQFATIQLTFFLPHLAPEEGVSTDEFGGFEVTTAQEEADGILLEEDHRAAAKVDLQGILVDGPGNAAHPECNPRHREFANCWPS